MGALTRLPPAYVCDCCVAAGSLAKGMRVQLLTAYRMRLVTRLGWPTLVAVAQQPTMMVLALGAPCWACLMAVCSASGASAQQ